MTIRELIPVLDAGALLSDKRWTRRSKVHCGSDLMSDVLAFVV